MVDYFVAVDFDGTITSSAFPAVGEAVPKAFDFLRAFQFAGAKLILLTMRSDGRTYEPKNPLSDAVAFCQQHGVEFFAVNENPTQKDWTDSAKVFAHVYIDDAGACVPLAPHPATGHPCVDWGVVGPAVLQQIKKALANG